MSATSSSAEQSSDGILRYSMNSESHGFRCVASVATKAASSLQIRTRPVLIEVVDVLLESSTDREAAFAHEHRAHKDALGLDRAVKLVLHLLLELAPNAVG